jgi:hypothetical protein
LFLWLERTENLLLLAQKRFSNNPTLLGPNFSKAQADQFVTDGIYAVTTELRTTVSAGARGDTEYNLVTTLDDFTKRNKELGFAKDQKVDYYKKVGDQLTLVDILPISTDDMIFNQVKQLSKKGGIFNNLSAQTLDKRISIYESTKRVQSSSSGSSIPE